MHVWYPWLKFVSISRLNWMLLIFLYVQNVSVKVKKLRGIMKIGKELKYKTSLRNRMKDVVDEHI
jgi:hypothetical protein